MMSGIWISLLILKNCAFALVHPISLLFYRFLLSGETFHNVKLISKKGIRNNEEDYRGVASSSAIPKHFELLLFDKPMYDDLKNLISAKWVHEKPIHGDKFIGILFICAELNLKKDFV
jgi:hypothetical protein